MLDNWLTARELDSPYAGKTADVAILSAFHELLLAGEAIVAGDVIHEEFVLAELDAEAV
jgi:hypothetical protein